MSAPSGVYVGVRSEDLRHEHAHALAEMVDDVHRLTQTQVETQRKLLITLELANGVILEARKGLGRSRDGLAAALASASEEFSEAAERHTKATVMRVEKAAEAFDGKTKAIMGAAAAVEASARSLTDQFEQLQRERRDLVADRKHLESQVTKCRQTLHTASRRHCERKWWQRIAEVFSPPAPVVLPPLTLRKPGPASGSPAG
jgi:chromosome segregation ATPase